MQKNEEDAKPEKDAKEDNAAKLRKKYQEEKIQNKLTLEKKDGERIFYGDEIML